MSAQSVKMRLNRAWQKDRREEWAWEQVTTRHMEPSHCSSFGIPSPFTCSLLFQHRTPLKPKMLLCNINCYMLGEKEETELHWMWLVRTPAAEQPISVFALKFTDCIKLTINRFIKVTQKLEQTDNEQQKKEQKKCYLFKTCGADKMPWASLGRSPSLPRSLLFQFCGLSALQHNCREGCWLALNIFFSLFLVTLLLSSSSLPNADSNNCESQCLRDSVLVLQLHHKTYRTAVFWKRDFCNDTISIALSFLKTIK